MSNNYDSKNIIEVSNRKALEWSMAQKRIENILAKFSNYDDCQPEHIRSELEAEIKRMWADLETYKIELEMQNDELFRAFKDAEDFRKDYVELFNSSPVGYLILNSSAIILNANQTFADMVKTELSEIYHKPFQNFIAQDDVSDFLSRFKSYFKNPYSKFFELTLNDSSKKSIIVRLEGSRKTISGFGKTNSAVRSNISNSDKEQEVLLISLSDITLLKQAEEERERLKNLLLHARKMESIGTLAAGIAHDFNNILFPILGFSEMIKDDLIQINRMDNILTNVEDKFLKKINDMIEMSSIVITNTMRAKSLVKQILAFSKDNAIAVSPIYINLVLAKTILSIRSTLPADIRLIDIIDNNCSMIMGDTDQIRQVIINLINNAVESMETKGGTITITLKEDNFKETCNDTGAIINGRYVCLSVKDTGCGIEKEHLSRIFDPYFSTKEKFKGGGLGLSLVHGIVISHKGSITVKSIVGEGSEFSLFFPCCEPESDISNIDIKEYLIKHMTHTKKQ
ncbi:MAG: nitrogen regulation protein NR(II) [Desulfamplus sp.]